MKNPISLTEQLAKHLMRPVDDATRARARLHLLDWLACVAGARPDPRQSTSLSALGDNSLIRSSWLGNVLEMDDIHRTAILHPGPAIWPITMGKFWAKTFDAQLDAGIRGYEAMIAIGETFDASHYAHFHNTSTAGVFGAAATGANLLDCNVHQTANALGFAGSVSGGLWQMRHEGSDAKQWHLLNILQTGENAARSAGAHFEAPKQILEGPQGLYAATCREPKPMTFPDQWRIHEVSFKPWAACRHAHPVIDCALELRAAGKLQPPFVVETYADAINFCDKSNPQTQVEAKFSLQHSVAVIADGRDATPADFTQDAISALAPLRAQVTVLEAPEITARYPAHFGARLNGLELIDCRGDPERPVGETEIIAKMHMLAHWGGLPAEEADRAVELALRGDDAGAIITLLDDWLK